MLAAPVWIASPPEVHSALLSSGPGPGPLLSAAGAWNSISAEYASAAGELTTLLSSVQATAWQGSSAEQYAAAHTPYLAWLTRASADSAGVAAQHEVAASAYTSALATMPTLAELAANHMAHGVLVATNFFGINTIPIALNEADYVWMWVQAATTMGNYHAVSGLALASAPRTTPAPPVAKTNNAASAVDPPPSANVFVDLYNQLVQLIQNPAQTISAIMANPAPWFPLLFFLGYEAFFIPFGNTFWSLLLSSPALILPIAIGAGINYLGTLGEATPAGVPAPPAASTPAGAGQAGAVVAGFGSGIAGPGVPSAPAVPAAAATAAPAAPMTGFAGFGYLVGGANPGTGFGPTLTDRTKAQAPAARVPAAAAAVRAPSQDKARARGRRRKAMKHFADEYLDLDADSTTGPADEDGRTASVTASNRDAGGLGFTGTAKAEVAGAAGLIALADDGFGGGPSVPMLPDTWGDGGSDTAGSFRESE